MTEGSPEPRKRGRPRKPKPDPNGAPQDESRSVLLKLGEEERKIIANALGDAARENLKLTQSEFFAHLLTFFKRLPKRDRLLAMTGQGQPPIVQMTRLLTLINAANHTFSVKRFLRCLDDHRKLLVKVRDFPDLRNWVQYRIAYVLHANCYKLRERGLALIGKGDPESFASGRHMLLLTMDVLEEAIRYGRRVRREMRLQATFNLICHFSFQAQIRTEIAVLTGEVVLSGPTVSSAEKAESIAALEKLPQSDGARKSHLNTAAKWFDEIAGGTKIPALSQILTDFFRQAVETTSELVQLAKTQRFKGSSSWLMSSLEEDPDLDFIRTIAHPKALAKRFTALSQEMRVDNTDAKLILLFTNKIAKLRWSIPEEGSTEK